MPGLVLSSEPASGIDVKRKLSKDEPLKPKRGYCDGTVQERLAHWSIPEPNSGCLLWVGAENSNGYGVITVNGTNRYVHRLSYEFAKGSIPNGLQLDHLCRVRCCLNPNHLEPVSCRENLLRGDTLPAREAAQTHCLNGHPLSGDNLYREPNGRRYCKICRRLRDKKRR